MSQFRPISSFQQLGLVDMAEKESINDIPISPPITTSPLILFPGVHTEPLGSISDASSGAIGTLSLTEALQSSMFPHVAERIIVIPGSKKREQDTARLNVLKRRMSLQLRQSIILSTVLFVIITTLISLSPLAKGQSASPIFLGFNSWVPIQQLTWQIQSHITGVPQSAPVTVQNNPSVPQGNPPPVSLPANQYIALAQQDAIDVGIPPDYFVRQINAESGFNPNAVSPAGAVGIAQFIPSTAANLGIDPWNPVDALRCAARLMASYAHNYGGDYAKSLAAYNSGSGTVQYAVNACGSNWMSCLPGETRNYIYKIMGI